MVTVVYSGIGFATAAAQSGLIRDLLPDEALGSANGRLTTIDQTFRLVMPVIGAGVYVAVGPMPLVLSAVVAFVVAAFFVSRIVLVETPPTPRTSASRSSPRSPRASGTCSAPRRSAS
ncbi:hypothetical protein NKG05_02170 [Oerskovia sp. M15]